MGLGENIFIIRQLRVRGDETISLIKEKVDRLIKDKLHPELVKVGQDYLSGARSADNYHTTTLLIKLYRL